MASRITIKVLYTNGDSIKTEINATFEEARAYYVGQWFNIGRGEEDNMQKCISIELI